MKPALLAALREVANDPRRHVTAGDHAMAGGDYDQAVRCFYKAIERDVNNLDALKGLAIALVAAERDDEAIPIYRKIIGMSPDDRTAAFNLGNAYMRLRQFGQAEEVYLAVLARHDDFVQARYNLATACLGQGKLTRARDVLREVIARANKLAHVRTALGEVLMDLNDFEGAMAAYSEATKLEPKVVTGWVNFAAAARSAGSYGTALVAIERAAGLAPKDPMIPKRKGELLLELHRRTGQRKLLIQAVRAWQQSLELDPKQLDLRDALKAYDHVLDELAPTGKLPQPTG